MHFLHLLPSHLCSQVVLPQQSVHRLHWLLMAECSPTALLALAFPALDDESGATCAGPCDCGTHPSPMQALHTSALEVVKGLKGLPAFVGLNHSECHAGYDSIRCVLNIREPHQSDSQMIRDSQGTHLARDNAFSLSLAS